MAIRISIHPSFLQETEPENKYIRMNRWTDALDKNKETLIFYHCSVELTNILGHHSVNLMLINAQARNLSGNLTESSQI